MDERRQHQRHRVTMAVAIKGHAVQVYAANMEDVSLGGARIATSRPPPEGTTFDVIIMRDDGPPLCLHARVQRCSADSIGVAWVKPGERELMFLLALMQSH